MEKTLIEFLFELNSKGLINDFSFDFENEVKSFLKNRSKESCLSKLTNSSIS